MPKAKTAKPPKSWKQFKMLDGTTRYLPPWADEPLKFIIAPDEALQRGARARPRRAWGKVITTGRKSRR
jgi:hypothetical protein